MGRTPAVSEVVRLCKASGDCGRGGGKRVTIGLGRVHGNRLPAKNKRKELENKTLYF